MRGSDAVVGAAVGVGLADGEVGTSSPVDGGEGALHGSAFADAEGVEAVGVGGGAVGLHIDGGARGRPLHDAHAHTDGAAGEERAVGAAQHGLVGHGLRHLRHGGGREDEEQKEE